MITINPVKLNTVQHIAFGEGNMNNVNSQSGLMSLDKNSTNKINFEKDMYLTTKADPVQSNPLKAIGYNIVKAYNILCTPKKSSAKTETTYVHVPYWA